MTFNPQNVLKRYDENEKTALLDALLEDAKPKEKPKPKLVHFAETVEAAQKYIATEGQIIGLSTGWPSIDELVMGMKPGELEIVYGREKHRKSMFVQNVAANVALEGNPVLFIGLELTAEQNTERWLTMGYENLPIVYPEQRMPDYKDIDAIVEEAVSQGIKLVVVDHLHMWRADGANSADHITDICQEMKRIALDHNVPLILVSHVSGDKAVTGPPRVERLKGSTSIAQLADKVICVYSPGVEFDGPDNILEISIPLSRRLPNKKYAKLSILPSARLAEPTQPVYTGMPIR